MVEISNNKHVSVVIGPTQSGKDTFIFNLDPQRLKVGIKIGDGKSSCTKEFQIFKYQNYHLIGQKEGYILNTVGLGDTHGSLKDEDIALSIYQTLIQDLGDIKGGIDCIYFMQSLIQPNLVEKAIKLMIIALGPDIVKGSVIIASQGNKINMNDEDGIEQYQGSLKSLDDLSKKYGIKGGVVEFRGQYYAKNAKIDENVRDSSKVFGKTIESQFTWLSSTHQTLKFIDFMPQIQIIKNEIEHISGELYQKSKKPVQIGTTDVQKVKKERIWYTLWIAKREVSYWESVPEYKEIFTKTNSQVLEEAKEIVIKKNKEALNIKISTELK